MNQPYSWPRLPALALAAVAVIAIASSCRQQFSRDDPVLQKPVDELTDQEIARMIAVVKTNYGTFKFELHPEWAPKTCRAFIKLAKGYFYYGLTFHEVRPRAWIVTGDPLGTGEGGPGPGLTVDFKETSGPNVRGSVGLYFPYDPLPQPEIAGSQFYVLIKNQRWMNKKYSVFGKVIDGMSTVDRIGNVPVTPRSGKPRPYMPLAPVTVEDLHLEVKK